MVVQFFGTKQASLATVQTPQPETKVVEEQEIPEIPVVAGQEQITEETEEPAAPENLVPESVEVGLQQEDVEAAEPSEVVSVAVQEKAESEKTPSFFLFQFMTSDYYDLLQKVIYGSLVLILFSLLFTFLCDLFIYRKFEIQYKDVILKAVGFSALWLVLVFLDKMIIIQLLASNFRIN